MNIYFVSIFPEIYKSFVSSSLIGKANQQWLVNFNFVNPRDYTNDKHNQIDDELYGIWAGMLMKAKPMIDSIQDTVQNIKWDYQIVMLAPSKSFFDQKKARDYTRLDNLILISGRYEWIDYRFEKFMKNKYNTKFQKVSLGKFVMMWGELASMVVAESVIRLIPWVIKQESIANDSYSLEQDMKNIEHPQYTRPRKVYGMWVPETLLSGDHQRIAEWKKQQTKNLNDED